jgi:hypothetical protein
MNITTSSLSDKSYKISIYAIFALAVGMSLAQYLYNRSLWCDEAWVALNILNRDFGELLNPLDYIQVAPVLWLCFFIIWLWTWLLSKFFQSEIIFNNQFYYICRFFIAVDFTLSKTANGFKEGAIAY